jgi:hypothetical protein
MAKRKGKFFNQAQFRQDDTGAFIMPGSDGRVLGSADAWHRRNYESSPYCIPNELICAKIGTFLGLPIPSHAITWFDNEPFFSSLNFNPGDAKPPHIEPSICAEKFPWDCTGILFFDILVANNDRHDENLAVDNVANPRQLIVYDHDQALFGSIGPARLENMRDRLGVTGSPQTGGNACCLLGAMGTVKYFNEWWGRVFDIPVWFIEDACKAAIDLGINRSEATQARDFLAYRKGPLARDNTSTRSRLSPVRRMEATQCSFLAIKRAIRDSLLPSTSPICAGWSRVTSVSSCG